MNRLARPAAWHGVFALGFALLVGCEHAGTPRHTVVGRPLDKTTMHGYYDPMVTTATLHSMSLADIHFVPHTPALNALGIQRLDRLAPALEQYGGTVHYETGSDDEEANQARVDTIVTYLTDAGLDLSRITVQAGMSRGRGWSAKDSLNAHTQFMGTAGEYQDAGDTGRE